MLELINKDIIEKTRLVVERTRENAVRSIDHHRTLMYWEIGKYIVEEGQEGKDRAAYGKYTNKYLSQTLENLYG